MQHPVDRPIMRIQPIGNDGRALSAAEDGNEEDGPRRRDRARHPAAKMKKP
ncbi:hypothetical protein ACKZDW_01135 (plasmid) [Ralstonia syzygii subsp. celebesensis]